MFGNDHFERVRQLFTDQFEPDGTGFLYRKSLKRAPIRVTGAERDGFIGTFNRRLRYAAWSMVPATILLILLLALFVPDMDSAAGQVALWVGMGLILAPFLLVYYWAWNSPSRELERRTPVGRERTRKEVRQVMLARMTYGQLGLVVVVGFVLVLQESSRNDVLHGWGMLWLVFGAAMVIGAGVQAFRKWRNERDG
jgi:Na+/melibiose symporter-like transporter